MKISRQTIPDFLSALGSNAPVPGGGGASALAAAAGTALGSMAAALTVGKKKYAAYENEMQALLKKTAAIRNELISLIDKDAENFEPLAAAYKLPKDTAEQLAEKERVMEAALETASAAPLEIMLNCAEAIDAIEQITQKCSKLAISDAGTGAVFCKAALLGASLNVFINTKLMKNRNLAEKLNGEAIKLIEEYEKKADKIFAEIFDGLHC